MTQKNKSRMLFPLALCALLTMPGCGGNELMETAAPVQQSTIRDKDVLAQELAKVLASSTRDVAMRDYIKDKALERFDGDFNFLFAQSATEPATKSQGFQFIERLGEASRLRTKSKEMIDFDILVRSIMEHHPLLQIAVPSVFENSTETWDTKGKAPLVAFLPADFDEETSTTITAYDSYGNAYELDAVNPPKEPVIVVSENERLVAVSRSKAAALPYDPVFETESHSYYMPNDFNGESVPIVGTGFPVLNFDIRSLPSLPQRILYNAPTQRRDVLAKAKFRSMSALRAVEAWGSGDPEVVLTVAFTTKRGDAYTANTTTKYFSSEGWYYRKNWWSPEVFVCERQLNTPVMYWDNQDYGQFMKYIFVESDGGAYAGIKTSFTNNYDYVDALGRKQTTTVKSDFEVPAGSKDEQMGDAIVTFDDPVINGGTMYSTGILDFWITN